MSQKLSATPSTEPPADLGKHIENKVNNIMENVSFGFLLFVFTYFALIIPSLVDMHSFLAEHNVLVHFTEYLYVIPGVGLSYGLYKFATTVLIEWWKPNISPVIVRQNETPEQRLKRLGGYIYQTFYYAISWIALMYMTWDTIFCPPEFGGRLDITKSLQIWPYEVSWPVRLYYMLTLGHHIERQIHEFAHNRKASSFYTMTFHHVVTIMLIFLSFYCRHLMFGIPVILTHDFNDIFLNAARFLRESLYPGSASVFFLIMMVSWVYTRIWVYCRHIIWGLVYNALNLTEFTRRYLFMQVFFIPALIGLLLLNLFWGFQIIRVFVWRFVKKDKNVPFEDFKTKKEKSG